MQGANGPGLSESSESLFLRTAVLQDSEWSHWATRSVAGPEPDRPEALHQLRTAGRFHDSDADDSDAIMGWPSVRVVTRPGRTGPGAGKRRPDAP